MYRAMERVIDALQAKKADSRPGDDKRAAALSGIDEEVSLMKGYVQQLRDVLRAGGRFNAPNFRYSFGVFRSSAEACRRFVLSKTELSPYLKITEDILTLVSTVQNDTGVTEEIAKTYTDQVDSYVVALNPAPSFK